VKLLIYNHCDINISNSNGDTALILAALNCRSVFVKLLIDNHCDVNMKNNFGSTALIRAAYNGHSEC
jgi:ankyrin repeat protein